MWRNLAYRRNWLTANQAAQLLKRSTALSFSSSFSPVSPNQTAPNLVAIRKLQEEFETSKAFQKVMANQTDVSLSFAKHLFLKIANKNIVVSPLSIQVVLGIIAAESKGATLRQLLSFLKANSVDDLNWFASNLNDAVLAHCSPGGGACLSFANGLWFDKSLILKPSFKQILNSHYKATLTKVDFQNEMMVTQQINSWVEKKTSALIRDLVQEGSLDDLDRLVFANALYFKGAWLEKFDLSKAKYYDFHLSSGRSVKAPFMTSKEEHRITVCDGFKVLGLPYNTEKHCFTMYIFLPNLNDGLPLLVEKIGSQSSFLELHLPKKLFRVGDLRIPKFKISYEVVASNLLKELGLTLPFFGGELTEMADSIDGERIFVSGIFQKVYIEVNEEGTKAAAATTIEVEMACAPNRRPPPKIDFVADHPFLFLIREGVNRAVLFVGQVLNPLID